MYYMYAIFSKQHIAYYNNMITNNIITKNIVTVQLTQH